MGLRAQGPRSSLGPDSIGFLEFEPLRALEVWAPQSSYRSLLRLFQKKCFVTVQEPFPDPPEAQAPVLSIGCTGLGTPLYDGTDLLLICY